MTLFTSFKGRISRSDFWLGFLGLAVVSVVVGLTLFAALSQGLASKIIQLLVLGVVLYVWAAVITKRLHDRGKSAIPYAIIFLAPGFVSSFMKIFMIGYTPIDIGGAEIAMPGQGALIVTYISIAVGIWMLVELGFLKGSDETNRFGQSPLAEAQS